VKAGVKTLRKPAKTPAVQHETIPISQIPEAVLVKATFSPKPRVARKRQVPRAEKIKVMIVDDDVRIAETSARLLGLFGYECYAVYNVADALACAESFTPDVVLSDVIMDGMNGVELCQEIKHLLPECRILLLSGHVPTAHSLMEDSNKRGFNFELLAKPLRPQELVSKIESLFGGACAPGRTHLGTSVL
jgi:response regulator RpfG family c-di-GMP phosphodiesterase